LGFQGYDVFCKKQTKKDGIQEDTRGERKGGERKKGTKF